MKSPALFNKKRHGGGAGFALGCGCKDAKSVSVSSSTSPSATMRTSTTTAMRRRSGAGSTTDTLTSASLSSLWEMNAVAELRYMNIDSDRRQENFVTTSSFSGLLRELSELEKSVASWDARKVHVHHDDEEKKLSPPPLEQGKAKGEDNKRDLFLVANKENQLGVDGEGAGVGLEGSMAVVKQSDDPLGDFRRSMLQLIVENGIVAGEDLREMLRRFLTLNAPLHHDTILRAFAEIWDDVFVAATAVSRREPGRPPAVPMTPPRHRRSPPAWRV